MMTRVTGIAVALAPAEQENLVRKAREHIGGVAALVLGVMLCGCAARAPVRPPAPDPADVAEIESMLRAQVEAWNRGDLLAFVRGYADSPQRMTFVGSKGAIVRGRAALERRYLESYPEGRRGSLELRTLDLRRLGPDAYLVLGEWRLARPPDDPHGVFTLVFERGPEGVEIVHDHTSGAE
jgi:beta-aspartyl-peptidase (threonine type)